MEKINFQDYPSTDTPVNATNLNLLQTNAETEINSTKSNLETKITELDNDLQSQINSIGTKIFPVGSIYISVNNTNPSSFLGGTWQSFGSGRTLVGVDTSQTEFNTVLKSGGAKTHTLTTAQMPAHTHSSSTASFAIVGNLSSINAYGSGTASEFKMATTAVTASAGNGQAHNNLQPYITVYFWRRTA